MFQNMPFHGTGGYSRFGSRKLTFKKVVKLVMRDRMKNLFMDQIANLVRKILQEELDLRLQRFLSSSERSLPPRPETPRLRLKLRFINSPPKEIFAGSGIKAKDGSCIKIELVDAATNSRVATGPLSSSRLEIVALNGDFTSEIWDSDEFSRNILRPRDGKRPLIVGDVTVTLEDGVGAIDGDVAFSDNSSWTRSRKFRLGVRAVRGGLVEARTEPFVCKDQRSECSMKHYPPHPDDEVWRLEKVSKSGNSKKLIEVGICTVKEFRRCLAVDPQNLRHMLGEKTSNNKWETIVSHAKQCVLDETEYYTYRSLAHGAAVLLLNSVYEVMKVSLDGCAFRGLDGLSFGEKVLLDELKREAYGNTSSFVRVDGRAYLEPPPRSLQWPQVAVPGPHHIGFQGSLMDSDVSAEPERLLSFENCSSAFPTFQINDHISHFISSAVRNSFRSIETDLAPNASQIAVTGQVENAENAHHQAHALTCSTTWSPGSTSWAQQQYDNLYVPRTVESLGQFDVCSDFNVCVERVIGSPRARWCKIRAAIKLREVYTFTKLHTAARKSRRAYRPY